MNPRTCAMGGMILAFSTAIIIAVWHLGLVGNKVENDIDHMRAREYMVAVRNSMDVEISRLRGIVKDWTSWTVFCEVVLDGAQSGKLDDDFVKKNIQPAVLKDLGINYWILVRRGDGYVLLDIPKDSSKYLPKEIILEKRTGAGFVEIDGELHLIAFRELQDNAEEKSAPAILVMGKKVDEDMMHAEEGFTVVWWKSVDKEKYRTLPRGSDILAMIQDRKLMGIARLDGLDDKPLAEVQIEISKRAKSMVGHYFLVGQISVVAVILALLVCTMFILHLIRCRLPSTVRS